MLGPQRARTTRAVVPYSWLVVCAIFTLPQEAVQVREGASGILGAGQDSVIQDDKEDTWTVVSSAYASVVPTNLLTEANADPNLTAPKIRDAVKSVTPDAQQGSDCHHAALPRTLGALLEDNDRTLSAAWTSGLASSHSHRGKDKQGAGLSGDTVKSAKGFVGGAIAPEIHEDLKSSNGPPWLALTNPTLNLSTTALNQRVSLTISCEIPQVVSPKTTHVALRITSSSARIGSDRSLRIRRRPGKLHVKGLGVLTAVEGDAEGTMTYHGKVTEDADIMTVKMPDSWITPASSGPVLVTAALYTLSAGFDSLQFGNSTDVEDVFATAILVNFGQGAYLWAMLQTSCNMSNTESDTFVSIQCSIGLPSAGEWLVNIDPVVTITNNGAEDGITSGNYGIHSDGKFNVTLPGTTVNDVKKQKVLGRDWLIMNVTSNGSKLDVNLENVFKNPNWKHLEAEHAAIVTVRAWRATSEPAALASLGAHSSGTKNDLIALQRTTSHYAVMFLDRSRPGVAMQPTAISVETECGGVFVHSKSVPEEGDDVHVTSDTSSEDG